MSQFPALKPSSRSYQHASLPVSSFTSLSGKETRVLLGDTFHGASLSLSFQNLQEPAAQQLMDHFAAAVARCWLYAARSCLGWLDEYAQLLSNR